VGRRGGGASRVSQRVHTNKVQVIALTISIIDIVNFNDPDSTKLLTHYLLVMFQIDSTPVNVCRLVTCDKCKKTTWAGCGKHVETVMKDVKEEDKCMCAR